MHTNGCVRISNALQTLHSHCGFSSKPFIHFFRLRRPLPAIRHCYCMQLPKCVLSTHELSIFVQKMRVMDAMRRCKTGIIMHEFTRRHTISQSKAQYFKLLIPFLGQNQTEKYITAIMSAIQNRKLNQ